MDYVEPELKVIMGDERCTGCCINYDEMCEILLDDELTVHFFAKHGLLKTVKTCPSCSELLHINTSSLLFRCGRRHGASGRRKKRTRCRIKISARAGTWFGNSKLSPKLILKLTYMWLVPGQLIANVVYETAVSKLTVVEWWSLCRKVAINYCQTQKTKIGGPGVVVEVNEALYRKVKYKNGKIVEGEVVLGGIEVTTGRSFFVPLQDRTKDTLVNVINEWILPGSTIVTTCLWPFKKLEGYTISEAVSQYRYKKLHFVGYLAESLFKRAFPDRGKRLHRFLVEIAAMFPPK